MRGVDINLELIYILNQLHVLPHALNKHLKSNGVHVIQTYTRPGHNVSSYGKNNLKSNHISSKYIIISIYYGEVIIIMDVLVK